MSISYLTSQNARFILGQQGREIFLLRDFRRIWDQTIRFHNFQVVGIGNNGKTVVKSDDGIAVYSPVDGGITMIEGFDRETLESENSSLAKVVIDRKGEKLCIEKVTLRSKLSEKLFRILSSTPKVERGQALHELIMRDLNTGKQRVFYSFAVDRKIPHAFVWDISPDFFYIIWGEAQKVFKGMETKFKCADLRTEEIFEEFVLEGLTEWILEINNWGISLVDSPQKSVTRELLVNSVEGKKYKISISNEYMLSHLGKNFVAFQNRMQPRLLFKRFDDSVILEVSLEPLEQLNMDYQISFTEKDDIYLLVSRDEDVKLVHSNLERFSVDVRRWEMMVEQQKIESEIARKKEILETKERRLKEKKDKMKVQELMKTVKKRRIKREKAVADEIIAMIRDRQQQIRELQANLAADLIGKYEFAKVKHELEKEIESLRSRLSGIKAAPTSQVPPSFETREKPPIGRMRPQETVSQKPAQRPTPPSELKRKKRQRPPREKSDRMTPTEELSLQEELKKYIPTVVFNEQLEETKETRETKIPVRKKPPSRKNLPKVIEFDVPRKKIPKTRKKKQIPLKPKEPGEKREESPHSPVISVPTPPSSLDRAFPRGSEQDFEPLPAGDFERGPKSSMEAEIQKGFKLGSEEAAADDDTQAKLAQMRKKIEQEILQAVTKKKSGYDRKKEQIERYTKLINELKESYSHGSISRQNYLRLRQKYEFKLRQLEEGS